MVSSLLAAIERHPVLTLIGVFGLSRGLFSLAGGHFDERPLATFWQFLDIEVLADAPVRGLGNLHMQPPALNALAAVVLQIPTPGLQTLAFASLYAGATAFATAMIYRLVAELSARPGLALCVASVYLLSPETLLYEKVLLYTHLTASLLAGFAYYALRVRRSHTLGAAAACVACGVLLSLLYSLFHLVWLVIVLAAVFYDAVPSCRNVALIGILAVLALYGRNWVLFGVPGPSSWTGLNLALTTHARATPERLARAIGPGSVGEWVDYEPFAPLADYPPEFREEVEGPPELTAQTKANGFVNYNHTAYIRLSQLYAAEWRKVLRRDPALYLKSVVSASYSMFFRPSTDYMFVEENRKALSWYGSVVDRLFGRIGSAPAPEDAGRGWAERLGNRLVAAAWLLALGLGAGLLAALRRAFLAGPDRAWYFAVAFSLWWVMLVPLFVNASECERIRVATTPLMLVVLSVELSAWAQGRGSVRRREVPSGEGGEDRGPD